MFKQIKDENRCMRNITVRSKIEEKNSERTQREFVKGERERERERKGLPRR